MNWLGTEKQKDVPVTGIIVSGIKQNKINKYSSLTSEYSDVPMNCAKKVKNAYANLLI